MAFGDNLRRLRRERGFTQTDLAEKVGAWFTAISNIERGESVPSLEMAMKLADALDVSLDELTREAPDAAGEPA